MEQETLFLLQNIGMEESQRPLSLLVLQKFQESQCQIRQNGHPTHRHRWTCAQGQLEAPTPGVDRHHLAVASECIGLSQIGKCDCCEAWLEVAMAAPR